MKIFSAMPVSMVDERAMSVVTWLNSPKRRRQNISTVSNHLAIRGFDQLGDKVSRGLIQTLKTLTKYLQDTMSPRKPVTVNWRDIRATIQQTSMSPQQSRPIESSDNSTDEEDEEPKLSSPTDPENDPLRWLDEGLPDLSGFENRYFDLATQFDIARYVHILADSVSEPKDTEGDIEVGRKSHQTQRSVEASALVPEDNEWATWT